MKRLSIDFTWQPDRRPLRLGLLLLVLALEVGGWVAWQAVEAQGTIDALQSERQALLQTRSKAPNATRSPEEQTRQQSELKMAQGVIERLDTPWGVLFSAIDDAYDDQVTLLNVEPEAERREVQLTAEAKDIAAMQAYVRQIQTAPALADAYLASHQINQQDPLRPVRFIVHARWVLPPINGASKSDDATSTTDSTVDAIPDTAKAQMTATNTSPVPVGSPPKASGQ